MQIDWTIVKKKTLWTYEELIQRILDVMSYETVSRHYNHSMKEAGNYAAKLFTNHPQHTDNTKKLAEVFNKLGNYGVRNYSDLMHQVESRESCAQLLRKTKLPFTDLVLVLNHIFRWVLPHKLYLRELIDTKDETEKHYVEILRQHGTRFSLDILERGWSEKGRKTLTEETGIPEDFILSLVNSADMSRLPYSNRKTVKHLCLGGYNSVEKLARTDPSEIVKEMESYFRRLGVKTAGFIDLKGIAQWAKTIPRIVEA